MSLPMARKTRTQHIAAGNLGQHLALSVAAGLARSQLVPEPLKPYDAQHLSDTLNLVAHALARVAPLHVQDPQLGEARELSQQELEGAEVRRGATLLILKDGRKLSGVSMKRADLRQAVAILRAVGLPGIPPRPAAVSVPPGESFDPLACLGELERLLRPPVVESQADQVNRLAIALARHAADGRIANVAMQLISALHEARAEEYRDPSRVTLALVRLRAVLEENQQAQH